MKNPDLINITILIKKFLIWRIRNISDKNFMLILSIFVGFCSGLAAVLMKNSVHFVRELVIYIANVNSFPYIYILFPFIGILLTVLFVRYLIKKPLGHGIPMVLYSMSKTQGKIEKHNMFSRIIASSLTVGFGGSVGLEGPIVATGSAIGSNIGTLFRLNYKQIILLIGSGATGAIAAIFKAPIAAIIFALEVMMIDLTMSSLLPLLFSSITAALTSYLFIGRNYIYFLEVIDPFRMSDTLYFILLGILCGSVSLYFSLLYLKQSKFYSRIKNSWIKLLVGSTVLGILIFIYPSLYGEGYEVINSALSADTSYALNDTLFENMDRFLLLIILLIILFKPFATGATFGAGGVGGIFAPSMFMGANIGLFTALFLSYINIKVSPVNFALLGMSGLISGVIHAPLTAIFLIAEITGGYHLFFPLMIVSSISFAIVKIFMPNSVYTIILAKRGELLTHNADKNTLTLLNSKDLIEKNFLTIDGSASLGDLTKIIAKSSRTVYVVVDKENNFKGLVWLDHIKHLIFNTEYYDKIYVRDLMYMPDVVISSDMSVPEIADIFEKYDHYNIPVVDNGKYVGFISRARFLTNYRKLLKQISSD